MRPLVATGRADALALVKSKLDHARTEADTAKESAHPPLAIADAWNAYVRATNRPDSSEVMLYRNGSIWKRFITWLSKERPGMTFMREIDIGAASAYARRLTADKVTASTFNQHIGFMRLVWRCLGEQIRDGNVNPWLNVTKKRLQRLAHRRHAITPAQFDALLAAAGDADLQDLLFVLGMTGQRLVDALMLRWDAIDFRRKVITLTPKKTSRTGKPVFAPLFPALSDLLQKRRDVVGGALVFPALVPDYERDSGAISKRIQAAFEKAGLTTTEHKPGVARAVVVYGAHSLRYFYATQALSAGIPGEIIKRITDHTSDDMLEGYQHVDAAMIGGLAAKLGTGTPPPPALPAPRMIEAEGVRTLAEGMNGKTWRAARAELLTLLA